MCPNRSFWFRWLFAWSCNASLPLPSDNPSGYLTENLGAALWLGALSEGGAYKAPRTHNCKWRNKQTFKWLNYYMVSERKNKRSFQLPRTKHGLYFIKRLHTASICWRKTVHINAAHHFGHISLRVKCVISNDLILVKMKANWKLCTEIKRSRKHLFVATYAAIWIIYPCFI